MRSEFRRDQILFDGIGMNPVVDFGQIAPDIPAELLALFVLEPLELFDEIELEFRRYPRCKFKGDILMSIRASIAA